MNLHVGGVEAVTRVPEAADRSRSGGQRSTPEHEPFQGGNADPPPLHLPVDRLLGMSPVNRLGQKVILEVLADLGQVTDDLDAEPPQPLAVPDSGQLEELRRVDRAAGQDDFPGPWPPSRRSIPA